MKEYHQSHDIPVDEAPDTVLSLVPSVTESLFDLNLGDRLIGRTDYCIYPADKVAAVPSVGGTKNPDVQRIIDLKPGLVIVNQEENRKADAEALQAAGIPVWVTFPKTAQDVFTLLWDIMYLFDETAMVPRVRLIEQTHDYIFNISEANDHPPKTFVPIWLDPLMTFNADTYPHHLLKDIGGANVFAQRQRQYPLQADLGEAEAQDAPGRDTRYPRITWDEVTAAQPDVILLPSEPFAFTAEHVPLFQKLDVPAAKNNRIHLVDGSLLTWHGTRLAYALDQLPTLFQE